MIKYNEISKTLLVINVEYFLHVFTFLWETRKSWKFCVIWWKCHVAETFLVNNTLFSAACSCKLQCQQ